MVKSKSSYPSPNAAYYIYTYTHPTIEEFSDLLYRQRDGKRRKTISRSILNRIDPLALLVWYMDDGCLITDTRSGLSARLATYRYGLSGNQAIKTWLRQQYGISAKITDYRAQGEELMHYIRLNSDPTRELMALFEQFKGIIPDCMAYKFQFDT
jgi:hypothetical protein